MKMKKEYLVLVLVIVALTLYLALGSGDHPDRDLPKLPALDNAKINRMVIAQKDAVLEMHKQDEKWFIMPKNYPVDDIKIKNMVKAAAELTATAMVSESGNYQRYGLDGAQQVKIQIFTDDQLLREFIIGRIAPTQQHTFMLLADDAKVYHARGNLKSTFDQTLDSLRDKTVLSFEKPTLVSIQIQKAGQKIVLSKSEVPQESEKEGEAAPATKTQWQADNGQTVKEATINALLNTLMGLKCEDYMADDAKPGLTDATWTLTLKNDSETWTLSVYAPKGKQSDKIPGVSSSNDYAFLLPKSRVETIEKQIEELLGTIKPSNS